MQPKGLRAGQQTGCASASPRTRLNVAVRRQTQAGCSGQGVLAVSRGRQQGLFVSVQASYCCSREGLIRTA